jgi:hypothetical protein
VFEVTAGLLLSFKWLHCIEIEQGGGFPSTINGAFRVDTGLLTLPFFPLRRSDFHGTHDAFATSKANTEDKTVTTCT